MKEYYWRVKAANAGGYSNFSEPYRFVTGFPASPMLVSPAYDSIGISTNPTLTWNTTAGATSYCLQISERMNFSETSIVVDTCDIADTTLSEISLKPNSYYYWRVRATNTIGTSNWSDIYRFSTGEASLVAAHHLTPAEFRLHQSYPNPFNSSTTISFEVPHTSHVVLKIYDAVGREVAHVVDATLSPGRHQYSFNAADLASGVYIYRLYADKQMLFGKMLLLK